MRIDYQYDSVAQFCEHVSDLHQAGTYHTHMRSSQREAGQSWAPHDFDDTLQRGLEGGHAIDMAADLMDVDPDALDLGGMADLRAGFRRNVTGFMPDVPAYLSGQPLNMYDRAPQQTPRKFLRAAFHLQRAARVSAQSVKYYGRAILAVLDALALAGYAIELWGVNTLRFNGSEIMTAIKAKSSDTPWAPEQAAYLLADPSFSRRLIFRFMEGMEKLAPRCEMGYGDGRNGPLPEDFDCDVFLPYQKFNFESEQEALDYVMDKFKDAVQQGE